MTEKQKEILGAVIRTLDSIPVSGAQNLDKLLGCIRALLGLLNDPAPATAGEEQAKGGA